MVNKDRIVPIMKIDFLSMIGTVLKIASVSATVKASDDIVGNFTISGSGAAGTFLANQPAKSINFASGVTSGTVYFVPSYDFEGIKVNGSAATIAAGGLALNKVEKDAITLYTAALSSGEVTITAITPGEPE